MLIFNYNVNSTKELLTVIIKEESITLQKHTCFLSEPYEHACFIHT